jgi:basic membrane protein A and related proteins
MSELPVRFICSLILGLFLIIQPAHTEAQNNKPMKVGFIMVGPVSDYGYNYAHNLGRLYLQSHLTNIETNMAEKVPESADVERVMEKMIAQGNHLIFSTSYGYLEPAERVAKRHPEVTIMQTWRPSSQKNMGTYAAYLYEPLYAVGIVAGKMTKKNNIGFVCAHPIPTILQDINAFTLGARSVNPKVQVHIIWTNAWSDPPTEAESTKSLIESGADIIGCILDSPLTVTKIAEENHVMLVGTEADLQKLAPNSWLAGSRWNWGPAYCDIVNSIRGGTWKPECHWLGIKDGAVQMCSFNNKVPKALQQQALTVAEQIKQGKKIIFKGPLKDQNGKERLKAGQLATPEWLSQMNWFVEGVDATLPKH